jgi:hypothetical protein
MEDRALHHVWPTMLRLRNGALLLAGGRSG